MGIPPFARSVLRSLGLNHGKRTKVTCFTEVVFTGAKDRPDGLLVLDGGRGRLWHCLIEAKVGKSELNEDQISRYIDLARDQQIKAVLTISNQFVALPSHSPINLLGSATRGVDLFHWSWGYLLTEAMLLLNEDQFDNSEQRFLLAEMVRYFSDPSVGISRFDCMNIEWKALNDQIMTGAKLKSSKPEVLNSVSAWHQETRDLCLLMTRETNCPVRVRLSRRHGIDPLRRIRDDAEDLARNHVLTCTFDIPGAAEKILVMADFRRRSLSVSMKLDAPRNKKYAISRINWLLRQLGEVSPDELHIRVYWPGRTEATQAPLESIRENVEVLITGKPKASPTSFEVSLNRDLAGKFVGRKSFIEELEKAMLSFYERVGQHLRAYIPDPPQIPIKEGEDKDDHEDASITGESRGKADGVGTENGETITAAGLSR